MIFDYTVKTDKTFSQAVANVEKETLKAGFKVLHIHNIQKTLEGKGFKMEPLKVIEICNAKSAYTVLKANIKIGLFLPCRINVYVKDETTYISGMRPTILSKLFPKENLGNLPKEIDEAIKNIINNAK